MAGDPQIHARIAGHLDDALDLDDLAREVVEVPEWGGSVIITTMTGAQRDAWEQSLVDLKTKQADVRNVRAKLVVACAVDESGAPLFTAADVEALGQKSASALQRCAAVAQRLNALSEQALEDAKGNSSSAQSDGSTSSSPIGTAAPSATS